MTERDMKRRLYRDREWGFLNVTVRLPHGATWQSFSTLYYAENADFRVSSTHMFFVYTVKSQYVRQFCRELTKVVNNHRGPRKLLKGRYPFGRH